MIKNDRGSDRRSRAVYRQKKCQDCDNESFYAVRTTATHKRTHRTFCLATIHLCKNCLSEYANAYMDKLTSEYFPLFLEFTDKEHTRLMKNKNYINRQMDKETTNG